MARVETIQNRECGACTVCCTAKPISSGGMVKPPGITCEHCTTHGCGIYETRYDICIGYLCGWKWAPFIPEEMRPDKSGLLFDIIQEPAKDGYVGEVIILAFKDPEDFARGRGPDIISYLIDQNVAVYLSRPGPPGMLNAKVQVNKGFGPSVRAGNLPAFLVELRKVVQGLGNHRWEPFVPPDQR